MAGKPTILALDPRNVTMVEVFKNQRAERSVSLSCYAYSDGSVVDILKTTENILPGRSRTVYPTTRTRLPNQTFMMKI